LICSIALKEHFSPKVNFRSASADFDMFSLLIVLFSAPC
jgi:hypothetical protein